MPTLYLWVVDTLALKRGTWTIESGTKLGIYLWDGLEIEEAIFFLVTNTLIVFGLVAFDHAMAILLTFPRLFPKVPELPSPVMLVQALLTNPLKYDTGRVIGIQQAVQRLQKKSRSFYLASSTFSGRLRIDLVLLQVPHLLIQVVC
jgi:15-cis-phytoene synthase/lycopene beta-cyclase